MLCIVQAPRLLLLVLVCHYDTSVVVFDVIHICHVITEHHYTTSLHNTAAAALLSLCCSTYFEIYLKHLHNAETRFYCPQTFLSLDFQCRDDVSELN